MKIGLSTASYFHKLQVEDAVTDIARHGLPVCEVFLNTFSEYDEAFITPLAARVKEAKLSVYSVHAMSTNYEPQLFSIQSRQRADAWKLFQSVLRAGQQLGATHYVMHGPVHLPGAAKSAQLSRVAPILAELAACAREFDIRLTLENVSWCVFSTPEFGEALIERLGRGTLGFTLDVKQALRSGRSPFEYLAVMGEDLCNVHLCDAILPNDGRVLLKMPGQGTFDFPRLRDTLNRIGYTGPAFLEVYGDMFHELSELYEGVAYLDRVFNPRDGTPR